MKKNCVVCDSEFEPKRKNSTTCGLNKCAVALYRKRHPERVKACRKRRTNTDEFRAKHNAYEKMRTQRPEVKAKISKRNRELWVLHNKRKYQEYQDRKFGKPPMVNCAECGKEFQLLRRIRKGGKNTQKYCSKPCKYKRNNRKTVSTVKGAISDRIRRQVNHYLGKYRISKGGKTFALLGYSPMDLVNHLESQFTDGMTWENRSEWHIDHTKPVTSFDFTFDTENVIKECWALENLKPLWAKDNQSKGSLWEGKRYAKGVKT